MIKTTRWRPNTCGCVLEYTWDTEDPSHVRTHSQSRIVVQCQQHAGDEPMTLMARIQEEQDRIARMSERIQANHPVVWNAIQNTFAETHLSFGGRSADNRRTLVVSLPALTNAQRNALQTWCDDRWGVGRVAVTR